MQLPEIPFLSKLFKRKKKPSKNTRGQKFFSETAVPWNRDAAALLNQFLDTHTGKVFLANLAYYRPSLSESSDPHAVALQAKLVAGYERAISQIMNLTEPPPEAERPVNNYPDLDDNSAWESNPEKKE